MVLTKLLLSFGLFVQNNDTMLLPSQTLTISIQRSAEETYTFISEPANMPKWAAGLGSSFKPTDTPHIWQVETPGGPARVRFTPKNEFGIADHYVNADNAHEVYIPIRVIANGNGSEVLFTLFRYPDMTDETYARDKATVQKDLETLKRVLE